MARLFSSGAETQATQAEKYSSVSATSPTFITSGQRSGGAALQCASGAGNDPVWVKFGVLGATGITYYWRGYFKFSHLPSATTTISVMSDLGGRIISARLTSGGKLQLWNDTGTPAQIGSDSSATISADGSTWYRVELAGKIDTGATDTAALKLDGTTVASATGLSLSESAFSEWMIGWCDAPGASKALALDDIALNDETGANQNDYPGSGKIVLLKPISDNARATLWTGGSGGTTSLFDAVENTPPIGTATETDLTQIEHAGGAAGTTDAYDANLTTYTTAGMVSGDTVKVSQLIAVHGEDISTGAKLLNFEVISNPAIASAGNVTAGDTSPAALSTYPSEWGAHFGTLVYDSSVTLGTSPVMRARRPETASRVASVCFMGLMVEYQPGVATSLPRYDRRIRRNTLLRM